jgi:hypothetical protein
MGNGLRYRTHPPPKRTNLYGAVINARWACAALHRLVLSCIYALTICATFTEFQVRVESLGIASGSCLMQIHQIDKLHEAQARKLWNTQALEAAHKH